MAGVRRDVPLPRRVGEWRVLSARCRQDLPACACRSATDHGQRSPHECDEPEPLRFAKHVSPFPFVGELCNAWQYGTFPQSAGRRMIVRMSQRFAEKP
jgi:hypothetical protein